MLVSVELPGLVLTNERGQLDRPFLADLKNWYDSSDTNRGSEQREHGIGLYRDDDPSEAGRFPIIYGRLLSRRPGQELELRDRVMALKNHPTFELTVTDPTGSWRAEVAVSGKIPFDIHNDGWCDFEIPLEAEDPRRYGTIQLASTGVPTLGEGIPDPIDDPVSEGDPGNLGRVQVLNGGNAPSEPTIRISGEVLDGFEIVHLETGRVVRVTRPVLPESVITIDHSHGTVWVDGQSVLSASYVPVGEWFQVAPREAATFQWAPLGATSGNPQMSVEFAEASW